MCAGKSKLFQVTLQKPQTPRPPKQKKTKHSFAQKTKIAFHTVSSSVHHETLP